MSGTVSKKAKVIQGLLHELILAFNGIIGAEPITKEFNAGLANAYTSSEPSSRTVTSTKGGAILRLPRVPPPPDPFLGPLRAPALQQLPRLQLQGAFVGAFPSLHTSPVSLLSP